MPHLATIEQASGWLKTRVTSGVLCADSRRIGAGDGFIAWPGGSADGRQFVSAALQAGAKACLVEADGAGAYGFDNPAIALFSGLKQAGGAIADAFYGHPSHALDVVAITGTNGKTSTAWWIAQSLNALQSQTAAQHSPCALIGTLGLGTPGRMKPTGLTTPDPIALQSHWACLREQGAKAAAIEASSIGLAEHRMVGTQVRVAIFTNFTQDHLDYHQSMAEYWLAKKMLFAMPAMEAAVINIDDAKGQELVQECQQRGIRVLRTSIEQRDACIHASDIEYDATGMVFSLTCGAATQRVHCPSVGAFNVSNFLGVFGALHALGIAFDDACRALSACSAVPGRMQSVQVADLAPVVVDYAHTEDALAQALCALRPWVKARGGALWCVFGCGGNRDTSKRSQMARAAQRGADRIVITSDNPRDEEPQAIAQQVLQGLDDAARGQAIVQIDRAKAIAWTIHHAAQQDLILIAGKGHEDYQEIAGTRIAFSDEQHALAALNERARGLQP